MKLKKCIILVIVFLSIICFPTKVFAIIRSGSVRIQYFTNPGAGMTSDINSYLNGIGYTSTLQSNVTKSTMDNTLSGIHKVVFIKTHGNQDNSRLTCSNGYLYPSDVTSSGIDFAYLEACYSSVHATGVTSFRQRMQNLGVPMTVGFMDSVTYYTQSDGINFFSYRTFYYLSNGYQLNAAIISARNNLYSMYNTYFGTDLVEYTGVFSTLP